MVERLNEVNVDVENDEDEVELERCMAELSEFVEELDAKLMEADTPSVAPSCKVVLEKPIAGRLGIDGIDDDVEDDGDAKITELVRGLETLDESVEGADGKLTEVDSPSVSPSCKVVVEKPTIGRLEGLRRDNFGRDTI